MPKPRSPEQQRAHDVLAAEEFGMPAPDPVLHHGPVTLPDDPTGIAEAHDVLAAEEFALPAGRPGAYQRSDVARRQSRARIVAAGALAFVVLRRMRRRRGRA